MVNLSYRQQLLSWGEEFMNIDKIYKKIKEFSKLYDIQNEKQTEKFTATSISNAIGIKRNVVSHFLNILSKDGMVIKINTRPVYFIDKETIEQKYNLQLQKNEFDNIKELLSQESNIGENNSFNKLIGYNTSLKHQIDQCKSAVIYPPSGLPVLLNGQTGTGKSYMARLIYEYAIEKRVISKDAPFNIFNCADYANNPELLSANLFGYAKGTFTGADTDKAGIIEKSDGGFLFLDEVHRLTAEGQEKLFILMDKSICTRMGENSNPRRVNVRLIFATTEKVERTLIGTFLRRIPIIIDIPDLEHRGKAEKLEFIYSFFHREALNINKDIFLSSKVLSILLNHSFKGNIGELKNTIKYMCANTYANQESDGNALSVSLNCLPDNIIRSIDLNDVIENIIPSEGITISPKQQLQDLYHKHDSINDSLTNTYIELFRSFEKFKTGKIKQEDFISKSITLIDNYFDKIVFLNKDKFDNDIRFEMTKNVLSNILDFMSKNYGLKFYGNTTMTLCYYLNSKFYSSSFNFKSSEKSKSDFLRFIKEKFYGEYNCACKLLELIKSSLDVKYTIEDIIIITLYIKMIGNDFKFNKIKAIIVAHGYSTASSIANVANRLLGQKIFEAFDMPIDMPTVDVINKLQKYIDSTDTLNGLIILVDMGSLEEIYKNLEGKTRGIIGIANNITTQMALDVGNMIQRDLDIKTIMEKANKDNVSRFKLILPKQRKNKAIITTCITGIGTAIKIKNLLLESLQNNVNIEVIACDYMRLKNNGYSDEFFVEYDVLAIVGTANPGIKEVKYIALEDIISGAGERMMSQNP